MTETTRGLMFINDIEVRFTPWEQTLITERAMVFLDIFGAAPLLQSLCFANPNPPPLLLKGPKGQGKSLLLEALARSKNLPFYSLDCSVETRDRALRGGFIVKAETTPFIFGALSNVLHAANEHGVAMLVLEEINALSPELQKLLNPLTDYRKKLELPEVSHSMVLRKDAILIVAATMTEQSRGVYELNDDLRSRFRELEIPYPDAEAEAEVLLQYTGSKVDPLVIRQLIYLASETRQEGVFEYTLSTRDLVGVCEDICGMGVQGALFMLCQKFNARDRRLLQDRIRDRMQLNIDAKLGGTR